MRRALIAFVAALAVSGAAPAQEVGDLAPDFSLETWFNGTGEKSLNEFAGKVILVEIWATW